jgi:hypothetical protein
MYYTTTIVSKPTAHITKKKSRLKIYNGNVVFLNDKDNFEFEIHNPTQKSVLCKIKLNGEYISTSGIILKPGQRVFLERFLDSNHKFEFSTYEVKDTSENRDAIDLNGDVKVEFYDEQTYHQNYGTINLGYSTITTGSPYYGDATFTNNSSTSYFSTTSLGPIGTDGPSGPSGTNGINGVSNTFEGPNIRSLKSKKSIETGRVEKGEKSNQQFTNSYQNFNYLVNHSVTFKILPLNNKNKTTDEIKHYCTECGTKTKSKYKFCPSCGNKL